MYIYVYNFNKVSIVIIIIIISIIIDVIDMVESGEQDETGVKTQNNEISKSTVAIQGVPKKPKTIEITNNNLIVRI